MGEELVTVVIGSADVAAITEIKKILYTDKNIESRGEALSTADLLKLIEEQSPSIAIVNFSIDESSTLDLIENVSVNRPDTEIIAIGKADTDKGQIKELMKRGAREYLAMPVNKDELLSSIQYIISLVQKKKVSKQSREEGLKSHHSRVLTIFSTKGGVGRSLIACNLACELAAMTKEKVVLIDLDLQFGDVAMLMNVTPAKTIASLVKDMDETGALDENAVDSYMVQHSSGVKILAAPLSPEEGEIVKGEHITHIIEMLKKLYNYIIIDTPAYLVETVLIAFDLSDNIFLILTPDLPTLKSGRQCKKILEEFHYSEDKVKLILNRSNSTKDIKREDIKEAMSYEIFAEIPSEGGVAMPSVNMGVPFVTSHPNNEISKSFGLLVGKILNKPGAGAPQPKPGEEKPKSFLQKLFKTK